MVCAQRAFLFGEPGRRAIEALWGIKEVMAYRNK